MPRRTRLSETKAGQPESLTRVVISAIVTLALGGASLGFAWTTLNAALLGTAGAGRIILAVGALLLVVALLVWLGRELGRLAPRR